MFGVVFIGLFLACLALLLLGYFWRNWRCFLLGVFPAGLNGFPAGGFQFGVFGVFLGFARAFRESEASTVVTNNTVPRETKSLVLMLIRRKRLGVVRC